MFSLNTENNKSAKKYRSLFSTLMLWFLLLSLVPMGLTSWVNYQQAKQSLTLEAEEQLHQRAESIHKFVSNWFAYRFMDITVQARGLVNIRLLQKVSYGWHKSGLPLKEYVNSYDWQLRSNGLQDDLLNLSDSYDYIDDLFLIDTDGNILFTIKNEDDLGKNLLNGTLSSTKFAKTVASTLNNGSMLFSDIERYGPSEKLLSGFLTAPLIDESGEMFGVFAMQLNLVRIFNVFENRTEANSSQVHYLVGTDGLLRSPMKGNVSSVLARSIDTNQFIPEHSDQVSQYQGPHGKRVFGAHQLLSINNINWLLISEIDSSEVLETSAEMASTVLFFLFFSVFIITVIAFIQVKRITTPLQKLSRASANVALGKENQQVDIDNNNEIGKLASEFNNMLCKQRQAELDVGKSNEQLRNALSELSRQQYALDQHAIVAITDRVGEIVFVNDKFCEISGYSHKQLIGSNHRIVNSGVHPKSFFTKMFQTISSGEVWHGKICNRNQNGDLYWVETTITPYCNNKGVVQQYISIRTDITKQKAFEQQQQNNLKIAAVKLAITNTFSLGGSFNNQLSEGLLRLFDLPNFNLKPKACLYIFNSEKQVLELIAQQGKFAAKEQDINDDRFIAICEHGLHSHSVTIKPSCSEIVCAEPEGHGHYIVPLVSELGDNGGINKNLVGVILLFSHKSCGLDGYQLQLLDESAAIFTNAILRVKANNLLRKATQTAEQNNRLKGEFLASMSHEIRTPMNGVLGMLGLLLNSELNADQKHKAKLAKSSAKSLLALINDILDFSKVEAGKIELDIIDFNLREMLGEISQSMALRADEKNIEIVLDLSAVDHSMVKGDPVRIRQIFTNLMSNAIKFTERGQVLITVDLQEREIGELFLKCEVEDSGIGICNDKILTLFEVFTQVDASTTRKYGGTGLGLAICKKLSLLMGGDIQVTSELGKGSTFSFTVLLQVSEQSQRVFPLVDISKLHLLIVDDNTTNLAVLRDQLSHWGAIVSTANDAQAALDLCFQRSSDREPPFDIALLDMKMPGMDGIELGRKLREAPIFDEMKLVMMTSISSQNKSMLLSEAGFNAYFPKPATTSDLFKVLSVVIDNDEICNEGLSSVTPDYLSMPAKSMKGIDKSAINILLVEDNKINQMVASGLLKALGFVVEIAEDGVQALKTLNEGTKASPYHIIFMDCQMPVMDGYETTTNIRLGEAGEDYKAIPIIAMTANAMEGDREKCLQAGMNDYIGKPIKTALLESKLNQWLALDFDSGSKEHESEPIDIGLVTWHQESALERLVNKKSLLISLITTFIEEMPGKIELLRIAISSENKQDIASLAHNIKGAAANLSALKIAHYCAELEMMAKSKEKFDDVYAASFEHLSSSYNELIDEFKRYLSESKVHKSASQGISYKNAISFLITLNKRLAESDYIESDELMPLLESDLSLEVNELLNELQQMIMMFELNSAQQLTENIIAKLQVITAGDN